MDKKAYLVKILKGKRALQGCNSLGVQYKARQKAVKGLATTIKISCTKGMRFSNLIPFFHRALKEELLFLEKIENEIKDFFPKNKY